TPLIAMSWSYLESASIRQVLEKYRSPARRLAPRPRWSLALVTLEDRLTPAGPAGPDLAIFNDDHVSSASPGQLLIYDLTVKNFGPNDSSGVVIHDTLPDFVTFVATNSSAGWSFADGAAGGSAGTINLGNLAAGTDTTVQLAVRVNATVPVGTSTISNRV